MEKGALSAKEQQIQDARDCLNAHDDEIELIVDSGRGDYEFARISVLMKYLKLNKAKAKNLLKEVDTTPIVISKKIEEVQQSVAAIQEDVYEVLTQQFASAYNNFLTEYNLNTDSLIPENLKNINVFEFPKSKTETHRIPLWLAHMLLKPQGRMSPQAYMRSVMGEHNP